MCLVKKNKVQPLNMHYYVTACAVSVHALRVMCKLCAVQINLNVVALFEVTFSCCLVFKKKGGEDERGEIEGGTGTLSLLLSPRDRWPGLTTSTASTSTLSITTR